MDDLVRGDVIQIVDEEDPWHGCLLVVDEVKSFGVQAFCSIPENNAEPSSAVAAYRRMNWEKFRKIGHTAIPLHDGQDS